MSSNLRRSTAVCGIAGPLALTVYFAAPAVLGWPYAGAPASDLAAYASSHETLFYAGAWFQSVGTLLSVVFFVGLVALSTSTTRISGLMTIVASTSLLVVVLVEAAFLVAVPAAASAGDLATVATAFALSNGTFARVFAIGPAPATYIALGVMLGGARLLPRAFGGSAFVIGALFAAAGVIALFVTAGVVLTIVLSVAQELWIVAAAIALLRSRT